MAYSDRELLARLIQCEAGGEGDNGMKAVAGVVMNRVHATGGEYARVGQGSIRNIIFQPYQFVCASETEGGAYNPQNIYNMRPEAIHYEIADWAIAGNRLPDVAESLWFYNPFGPDCRPFFPTNVGYWQTRIGDHCFYNPTGEPTLSNPAHRLRQPSRTRRSCPERRGPPGAKAAKNPSGSAGPARSRPPATPGTAGPPPG